MKKYFQISFILLFLIFFILPSFAEKFENNVVSISVATQSYDFNAPWQKLNVQREVISGVVLKNGLILTVSHKLADHVLVEVSKFGEYHKYPAKILLKDYQCGLALITVPEKNFFSDLKPVEFNSTGSARDNKAFIVRWDINGILKTHSAEYQKSSIEFLEISGAVLIHQMTSDIDFGGLGEPVFVNGKLTGITLLHSAKNKTVRAIDIAVIERMLKDFQSGTYKGLPFFNIEDASLSNDENLRESLGLSSKDTGVLVINVPPKTSGFDVLKKNDIILTINDINLDDNGFYVSKKYGKLAYYGIIYLNHFIGDIIKMKVLRNKKKIDVSFKLKPFSSDDFLIPTSGYDSHPKYYIIGGLLFQELTREYLRTWGEEWSSTADKRLMYFYDNYAKYPSPEQQRLVILTSILPAVVNVGYHNFKNLILRKVNGSSVRDLTDLKNTIDNHKEKFLEFDFIGGTRIIIENNEAKRSLNDILQKYKIQSSYYVGNGK
jgi:S1-C subfamily serine protease